MTIISKISLDLKDEVQMYYNLLINEDFDFKTKQIQIKISKNNSILNIDIQCNSILDLKIANSAIIRSLEIIEKTLQI